MLKKKILTKCALNTLQKSCLKRPYKGFKDLEHGDYTIQSFSFSNTDHGKRVRVDMDDCYMYLPKRFADSLDQAAINELSKSPKIMTYSGKDHEERDRLILEFKEYEKKMLPRNKSIYKYKIL